VRLHVSHLRDENDAAFGELMEYVDGVARHEVDFSFDVYPYQSGSTMLSYILPYDVWEDGPLAALAKLHDPEIRLRVRDGIRSYRNDTSKLRIGWVGGAENKHLQGMRLSDYVESTGLPAEEALVNLLIEERLAVLLVIDEGDDKIVEPWLAHDLYMMGTDGIYFPDGHVHPRQFGSAGRLLGRCVRELKLFSLEAAVRKLSGYAAERFRLPDRGVLKEGKFADVVVFDPDTVADRATYDDPQQHTVGIEHVFVNGTAVVRDGAPLDELPARLPGQFVRSG
jgi:N-acyl-D-amino-acid deacylase